MEEELVQAIVEDLKTARQDLDRLRQEFDSAISELQTLHRRACETNDQLGRKLREQEGTICTLQHDVQRLRSEMSTMKMDLRQGRRPF